MGEECDDGNQRDGDGCDRDCRREDCGNGIVQSGEQCDDGNKIAADGCDEYCHWTCGNGRIETGEQLARYDEELERVVDIAEPVLDPRFRST